MDYHFIDNQKGLSVARVYGLDSIVEIPEADFGTDITEVSPYCFAEIQRGIQTPATLYGDEAVTGTSVEEVYLPRSIRKIGAYAFYNCFRLRKLSLYSTTEDLGAGFLTGCSGVEEIDFYLAEHTKSCLQEILMELPQMIRVNYFSEQGTLLAKLIFPAFYENSIENTPGRILMRDVHGCGIMYRNCFLHREFQFKAYDQLFREVDLYDGAALACELALCRLQYPYRLMQDAREQYIRYLQLHPSETAELLDSIRLKMLLEFPIPTEILQVLADKVMQKGNQQLTAMMMNALYERKFS